MALESKDQSLGSVITLPKSRLGDEGDTSTEYCPPDLLAFPGKNHQNSSEGIPYVTTSDRSPYPRPQKLLKSPQYASQFGTLPYSRSHSPFSPPLGMVPRQSGYVTIPRKPRVPSWNSPLSPVLIDSGEPIKSEPIYDNLGPRTTADGSSGISLNKSDGMPAGVAYKNRPLPQAPLDGKRFYSSFDESLENFSPVVKNSRTPSVSNRNNSVTSDKSGRESVTGTTTPDNKRQSWARITPEGSQITSTDETESLIGSNVLTPRITTNRKIPPNPPPKPKKKPGKTFFEDEGEDGTEV
ncbi:hypothetical protein RUM43_005938 [Polyplax serrata]|uniref:Uncharacterized protein n=1 Tax=Polyplax serrata TaxID=468196 RepID=A0AAN8NXK9_POLSC